MLSQKCRYALRAVLELSKRYGEGPVKIGEIAQAQSVPPRFLEVILNQLKQGGFLESRRGSDGGYLLQRSPDLLTVGDIIRFIEGPLTPVGCIGNQPTEVCPLHENCVFVPMWEKVQQAVSSVYDQTTFQDLVDQEARMCEQSSPSYAI